MTRRPSPFARTKTASVTASPGAAGRWSRFRTSYRRCPPVDDTDAFLPWLRGKLRSGEIGRVLPTTDLLAYYVSCLREEFSETVRRAIPPLGEIEDCLIKSRFAERCAKVGVKVPATSTARDLGEALRLAEEIGFPMIVKPNSHLGIGMAERGAVIESEKELRASFKPYSFHRLHRLFARAYPDLAGPLIQSYLPAGDRRVYSVSGVKDPANGIVAAALTYKAEQWPPRVGISTQQISCQDQRILQAGVAAVDALISCGIFELEMIEQDGELHVIELNPRGFGFMALDIELGNDLPWLWYQSTFGPVAKAAAPARETPLQCRSALQFHVSRWVGLLKGPGRYRKLVAYAGELSSQTVLMSGRWRDPLPMLIALLSNLRHPRSLIAPYLRRPSGGALVENV